MEIVHHTASAYAEKFSSLPGMVMQENERFTREQHPMSHMHSGLLQGMFLEMLSRMIQPLRVLDIGTFTGYSALSLCSGLQPGGILHTIEIRPADASVASSFFEKAGVAEKISLHIGDAMEIIPTLQEPWDIVFIDADKVRYIDYYELTLPLVKPGGWVIADNVLFHGQVLEDDIKGKNAKAIHAFNEHVAADGRVEQVMLTIRDGLLLIRKL